MSAPKTQKLIIEINNLTAWQIDKKLLKKAAEKVLRKEKKNGVLSVALVGMQRIRAANKKYGRKDKATDVLAFFYEETGLGEILICPEKIKKNAKELNFPFNKELLRALIHGILHLAGYEHKKGGEAAKEMKKKEEYYLARLMDFWKTKRIARDDF